MEPDSLSDTLQVEIGNIPHFIPNEQFCHITLHSISPSSESSSYKAFSVLVSDPQTSSVILTQANLIGDDLTIQDEISTVTYFPLEISHGERWVEVSIFDMNMNKLVLTTAVELSLLQYLHPYHLLAATLGASAKLSILRTTSSMYYHTFSGLEFAFVPGTAMSPTPTLHTSECVVSLEVMNLKPPPSYKPNIKFTSYSKQNSKTQTFYLATPSIIPGFDRKTAHYAFLPDACFKFRMESHYIVVALSRYGTTSPWYNQSPEILFYLELEHATLASMANRPLIQNLTDKVVYLKGNHVSHGHQTLLRMKRKDDPFMTLSIPPCIPPSIPIPPEVISIAEVREELEAVRSQREELKRLNDEYETRITRLSQSKSVQHLPSFSYNLLEQTSKPELIHKYVILQQERDLISRKLDQSKELVESLYVSLEGYSELQESFSENQESNLIQQEIVRHLQERAARYKKLAKLCQTQERTIKSYEEQFHKLLESQRGHSSMFTPAPPMVEYGVESVKELTEMEGKSDKLVSALQERLLQSSLRLRSPILRQKLESRREMDPQIHHSNSDMLASRNELYYDDSNSEALANDLREVIESIPKLDKLLF